MVQLLAELLGQSTTSHNLNVRTFRSFVKEQIDDLHDLLGWPEVPIVLDADMDWDAKRRALEQESGTPHWSRYTKHLTEPWFRKEVFDRSLRVSENGLGAAEIDACVRR